MRIVGRIVVVILCIIGGGAIALWAASAFPDLSPFGAEEEQQDSQVINAVNRTEQVSLVSLGIQGITENRSNSELFGFDVPGSERVSFIQYSFNAKLGIDGEDVTITQTGETSYDVEIPEFIFIGHDEISFASPVEENGLLSWVTADIDPLETVNEVLDSDSQDQYLEMHQDLLEEQAESFYRSLILSVEPGATVDFSFSG